MELYPAIDIRAGRCVRLLQGDFDRQTTYDVDPEALARRYRELGARWLHVVDLDGAARGAPANLDVVRALRSVEGLHIQLGGGIRGRDELEAALEVADRVVVGSLAVTSPTVVEEWLAWPGPECIALALDVHIDEQRTPFVATHGWTKASRLTLAEALERYRNAGLRHVLCTDVSRDGALGGPNIDLYRDCVRRWPGIAFQASGGVRDARDLAALADTGVATAISGKALLENRITDEELKPFLPAA